MNDQIQRSRHNLQLETIDVMYLHNPEVQLQHVSVEVFSDRFSAAFACLEQAVTDGRIQYYGVATWAGLRNGTLSIRLLHDIAARVAGPQHHFRFVQLPFNLGMREARLQNCHEGNNLLQIAHDLGLQVIASASIMQSRLIADLPPMLSAAMPGLVTDAQRAIQYARSTPGITSALVGMGRIEHVCANLQLATVPPLAPSVYAALEAQL